MAAGDLPERIAFDVRDDDPDEYGNVSGAFSEQFVVAASYAYLKGGESVLAARLTGTQPVIIEVRESSQTSEISTDWRARDTRSGTIYNIKSVMPAPKAKARLHILAVAGEAA